VSEVETMLGALRPEGLPEIRGLDLARGERRVTYKDAHDVLASDEEVWISLMDAAGAAGVRAATCAAQARACLRALCHEGGSPSRVLTRANRTLCELVRPAEFVAGVVFRWEPEAQTLTWSGAGLEALLVYRAAEERVEVIRAGGIVLAMFADPSSRVPYVDTTLPLAPGDLVLLASDGLTELSLPGGELLGQEAVCEALTDLAREGSAEVVVERLLDWVDERRGPVELEDDLTLVVIKRA